MRAIGVNKKKRKGIQMEPTQEELAEWEQNGCALCGAPGTSLVGEVAITASAIVVIRYDGSLKAEEPVGTGRELSHISCIECGEVLWKR